MANPNSPLTRLRFSLAQRLDPYPDRGEAWCMDCVLNGGRTLVLNANGHIDHIEKHLEPGNVTSVGMRVNWGNVDGPEDS